MAGSLPPLSKSTRAVRGEGMSTLTVTCFITLDDVVEDPQLWSMRHQSEDTGTYNMEVLRKADAMLLGRVTYDGFAAAWPSRSGDAYSDRFNGMPKFVVSSTLERADWNNTTIIDGRGDVAGEIRRIKAEQDLLVWGSPGLTQLLADEGLVDEYVLLVSPLFRHTGKRLFAGATHQQELRFTDSTLLSGGMLALRLTPAA
jgi:dihydrofolate reductase